MKKYLAFLTSILALTMISSTAMAETGLAGLTVGFGSQASGIADNFDLNGDPFGYGLNVHYVIPGANGAFVELDFMDLEDESDVGAVDTLTINQKRTVLKVGYVFTLDDSTSINAAVYNADTEWDWEDGRPTNFKRFEGDDSGISVMIGADKKLGNGVTLGTAMSFGFETGVEAYTNIRLVDNLNVRISYYKSSYELEYEEFDEAGTTGDGSAFGDGDAQFDTSGFRVSASYTF